MRAASHLLVDTSLVSIRVPARRCFVSSLQEIGRAESVVNLPTAFEVGLDVGEGVEIRCVGLWIDHPKLVTTFCVGNLLAWLVDTGIDCLLVSVLLNLRC